MPLYKFYRIVHKMEADSECYIGSTTQPLHKRFYQHSKRGSSGCSSKILFEKYGKENLQIVLIHELELPSRQEALREERRLFEEHEKKVNRIRPHISMEDFTEYQRKYRETNSEKIAERARKYREAHAEEISDYHKTYYKSNREDIKARNSKWNKANRETINAWRRRHRASKKTSSTHTPVPTPSLLVQPSGSPEASEASPGVEAEDPSTPGKTPLED